MKTLNNFWMNWRLMESVPGDGAPGGGGATPDFTPAPAGSDEALFGELALHDDVEPVVDPTPPEPVAPAAAPVPPAAASPPVAAVPPAVPPVPSPVAPPVPGPTAAPAAVPPGAPAVPGSQQPDPSGVTPPASTEPVDFNAHREKMLPELAKLYTLDEADVEALRTNPEKVLPTLAARTHFAVQHAVFAGVMQALPQMMAMYGENEKQNQENESAFFGSFPALKEKPEYSPTVISCIKAVRASDPNLTRDQLIQRAGVMASITLGIPLPGTAGAAPASAPAAAAPIARPVATIRPAGVGATAHIPAPAAPGTPGEQSDLDALIDAHLEGQI